MVEFYRQDPSDCHMTFGLINLHKLAIRVFLQKLQVLQTHGPVY